MPIVVTRVCSACGATRTEPSSGWVRCAFCRTLIAFDFQRWLESAEHRRWLARAADAVAEWRAYTDDVALADAALADGDRSRAEGHLRVACDRLMALTPHLFPDEAHTDPARREAHLAHAVWWQLAQRTDPTFAALVAEMQSSQSRLDLRDPWPTLRSTLINLERQHAHAASLSPPPDPDGLDLAARSRVSQSLVLSAYLHLLDHATRVEALRWLHGVANVVEEPEDELGLYFDFRCPRCGLVTLTARGATEVTCVGCYHRRPYREGDLGFAGLAFGCTRCGAPIALETSQLEARCSFCHAVLQRAARTGDVERDFSRTAMRDASGVDGSALPPDGVDGFAVTAQTREQFVIDGLARQAAWFARLVTPARYAAIVRKSFGERAGDDELQRRLRAAVSAEGGSTDAVGLVSDTIDRLRASYGG